jgi:hypothetical protein
MSEEISSVSVRREFFDQHLVHDNVGATFEACTYGVGCDRIVDFEEALDLAPCSLEPGLPLDVAAGRIATMQVGNLEIACRMGLVQEYFEQDGFYEELERAICQVRQQRKA